MSQSKLMDLTAIFFTRARAYISEAAALLLALLFAFSPAFAAPATQADAIQALKSTDLKTQYAALESLKAFRNRESADAVAQAALREKDLNFRLAVLDQVASLSFPHVIPALAPLLRDNAVVVRQRTARVIGMLGGAEAEKALTNALPREKNADVKAAILQGLSLCGSEASVDVIQAAMQGAPREVRANGVGALRRMRGPKSSAALEKARADQDPAIKKLADDEMKKRTRTK